MEQKRTGLSYVFTLAKEERGKLSLGMLLAVFSSALSFVPYLVVYQILLLIIKQEVTLPAMLGWAGIGIAAAVLQAILTSFAGICSHTAAFNTMHRIKVRVLEHMSKFNLGFFQEHAPRSKQPCLMMWTGLKPFWPTALWNWPRQSSFL